MSHTLTPTPVELTTTTLPDDNDLESVATVNVPFTDLANAIDFEKRRRSSLACNAWGPELNLKDSDPALDGNAPTIQGVDWDPFYGDWLAMVQNGGGGTPYSVMIRMDQGGHGRDAFIPGSHAYSGSGKPVCGSENGSFLVHSHNNGTSSKLWVYDSVTDTTTDLDLPLVDHTGSHIWIESYVHTPGNKPIFVAFYTAPVPALLYHFVVSWNGSAWVLNTNTTFDVSTHAETRWCGTRSAIMNSGAGDMLFFAVSDGGASYGDATHYYRVNGATATVHITENLPTMGNAAAAQSACYLDGVGYVLLAEGISGATGQSMKLFTSANGTTWTQQWYANRSSNVSTNEVFTSVAAGNGRVLALAGALDNSGASNEDGFGRVYYTDPQSSGYNVWIRSTIERTFRTAVDARWRHGARIVANARGQFLAFKDSFVRVSVAVNEAAAYKVTF